jgi:hypothetical protein
MEKSKKSTPEEAKREADEQIQKARLEREKQMESVQEIAEPMATADAPIFTEVEFEEEIKEESPAADKRADNRGGKSRRDKRDRGFKAEEKSSTDDFTNGSDRTFIEMPFQETAEEFEEAEETPIFESATLLEEPLFELGDSSFERIIDDEDTGDLFKDAYMQEAIVDKVRAIEFDMESAGTAEVGSLLDSVTSDAGGFERIADEDEEQPPVETAKTKSTRRNRGGRNKQKAADQTEETETASQTETDEGADAEGKSQKRKSKKAEEDDSKTKNTGSKKKDRGGKKTSKKESPEDAEASVKESDSTAQMAVRRGGRNRRRPNEQPRGGGNGKPETEEAPLPRSETGGEADVQAESIRPSNYRTDSTRTDNRSENTRTDNRSDSNRRERGNGGGRRERNQPTITDFAARRTGNSRSNRQRTDCEKGRANHFAYRASGTLFSLYADD